jgi:pantoate--beta-alanine ligase
MFANYLNNKSMPTFYSKEVLKDYLNAIHSDHSTLGFIPTMGALHQGHVSLMQHSLLSNARTVVSIFVNPTQFTNQSDLANYPRTLEHDLQKIYSLNSDIIVYAPTVDDIYEGQLHVQEFDFDGLEHQMEGKFRPGHFNGVGTIVKRLFEIVCPTNAYFGEKDFQQLQIIKKLVFNYNLGVTIIGCPIYRETNQLAMSSRNLLLSSKAKEEAGLLFKVLTQTKEKFKKQSAAEVSKWVEKLFSKNDLFSLEYYQIADEETLLPCLRKRKNTQYRAFIAVFVNNIRLIDTISLN